MDYPPFNVQVTHHARPQPRPMSPMSPRPGPSNVLETTYTPMSANNAPPIVVNEEQSDQETCRIPKNCKRKRILSYSESDNSEPSMQFTPKHQDKMSHATRQCFSLLGSRQRDLISKKHCKVTLTTADKTLANTGFEKDLTTGHHLYQTVRVQPRDNK